jgi:hypothetical protein
VALSHLSTRAVAQAEDPKTRELWFMLAGLNCSHGGWRPPRPCCFALAAYGLTAAGTGWVSSWACAQVEVQERCREDTERGEYGVDDYSERYCTSAHVTTSGDC